MALIVGTDTDSDTERAPAGDRWQAVPMDIVVVGVLTLSLLLILVAAVWIIAAALGGSRG